MQPNFPAVLADIKAERDPVAEKLARLTRWAADAQSADEEAQQAYVDERTYVAAVAIERIHNLSHSDAVVLLAAMYRAIHKSRLDLDAKYWVLAGLSDSIGEVLPTVREQLEVEQAEKRAKNGRGCF